jgi:hypothetical protein
VPPRLEALVQRLMSPEPDDRPASARAVHDELGIIELEMLSPSAPVTPPPAITPLERPPSALRRGLASAVIAAAFAGGAAMLVNLVRSPRDPLPQESPTTVAMVTKPAPAAPVTSDVPKRAVVVTPIDVAKPPDLPAKPVVANVRAPKLVAKARPKSVVKKTDADKRVATADQPPPAPDLATPPVDPDPPPSHDPMPPPKPDVPATKPAEATPKQAPKLMTRAKLSLADLSVRGSWTAAMVRRALERVMPVVTACYGPAVTRAGRSPSVDVKTRFEIDESQQAHAIQTASALPGLAECVDHALGNVRTEAPPDVGVEDVTFVFQFAPEGT